MREGVNNTLWNGKKHSRNCSRSLLSKLGLKLNADHAVAGTRDFARLDIPHLVLDVRHGGSPRLGLT